MKESARRYLLFILGVFFTAFGIGFITRAALGTSPVSGIPFVLSLVTRPSMGLYTLLFNCLLLVVEVLLRRSFTRVQALQIPFVVLFSLCIDGALWFIPTQLHGAYPVQVAYLLFGCVLMAVGITLEVKANVTMLPAEALVRAIAEVRQLPFSRVKMGFDITLTAVAALIAIAAFQRLNGVREGTLVAALLVGWLVGLFGRHCTFLSGLLKPDKIKFPG